MGLFNRRPRLKEAAEYTVAVANAISAFRARREQQLGRPLTETEELQVAGETLDANPVLKSRADGERWWQNRQIIGPILAIIGLALPPEIQITDEMVLGLGPWIEIIGVALGLLGGVFAKWFGPMGANVLKWVLPDTWVDRAAATIRRRNT